MDTENSTEQQAVCVVQHKAQQNDALADCALSREELESMLREMRQQPNWRKEADRAADYYDGNQLSAETLEILRTRGQPPLVTNLIKPTIDTVLGMEAKTRTDWRVRPEDDDQCSDEMAEALSLRMKIAEAESRADRAISDAYAAQCKSGLGWVEVSRESDPFRPPYRVRYVHRREIYWDWLAKEPDLSDARYLIRRQWLEIDQASAMMPQHAKLFAMTANNWSGFDPVIEQDTGLAQSWAIERDTRMDANDWRDVERQRVCLYEIWYRKYVRGFVMDLPDGRTVEADFSNIDHAQAIAAGIVRVRPAMFHRVRLAWYCGPHFLHDIPSPYKHRMFPYVPFFGYREDLTGAPYGIIRAMIAPQDEINARKSKMLWSLNSRRVIADADAVADHQKTMDEIARPDAYVVLDSRRAPNSVFRVEQAGELAAQQFQVMQEAKQEISQASGIHKSMMGQASGATSGLAINSLVEQGINTLSEINDNYRYARRMVGEMLFELLKQQLSGRPVKVLVGNGASQKTVMLNVPATDESGQPIIVNDVSRVRASVVLDDVPSTPTFRLQQLQMLSEITKSLPPQMQAAIADFIVEATDLPKRTEVAERIRAASGIQPSEAQQAQQMQAMQMQAQQMQMQAQMEQKKFALEAAESAARIRKLNAEADSERARASGIAAHNPLA